MKAVSEPGRQPIKPVQRRTPRGRIVRPRRGSARMLWNPARAKPIVSKDIGVRPCRRPASTWEAGDEAQGQRTKKRRPATRSGVLYDVRPDDADNAGSDAEPPRYLYPASRMTRSPSAAPCLLPATHKARRPALSLADNNRWNKAPRRGFHCRRPRDRRRRDSAPHVIWFRDRGGPRPSRNSPWRARCRDGSA